MPRTVLWSPRGLSSDLPHRESKVSCHEAHRAGEDVQVARSLIDYLRDMAKYPRVREQHVAVFGESGSGKTVLVSSFFGATQEGQFENDVWDLVADDAGQGNRLYQNYLGMREYAKPPMATRFANTTYYFQVKLRSGDAAIEKKRPFDVLRLAWHDYPGEWFDSSPESAEESRRRTDTFRSLLRSDVAVLLVDGQKLLDHVGEEERYLKALFGSFRQNLLRLKDDLLNEGRLVEFPRIWVLALSKADLLESWDVNTFRDLVILKAAESVEQLRSTVAEFVETPEALSIGEDFALLSSADFTLQADKNQPAKIDVSRRVGVDLILPVASLLPLERRVQWQQRMDIPWRVLNSLADGAEVLAAGLSDGKSPLVQRWLARLGRSNEKAAKLAEQALPYLADAASLAGPKLRELNQQAQGQHDRLKAMLTGFKIDLEQGHADKVIRTAR